MLVQILLCLMCVLVLLVWWFCKLKTNESKPPVFPGSYPIIGHALTLLGDCTELWETMKNVSKYSMKVGEISRMFIATKEFYVITDHDDFLTVVNTCLDKSFLYDYPKDWVGVGLVTADLTSWKISRKLFGPAFTHRALYRFLDLFNSQARVLVNDLASEAGKGDFDHYLPVVGNMLATVNKSTLGMKNEDCYLYDNNYIHNTESLFDMFVERLQKIWLIPNFLYNRSDLKRRQDKIIDHTKVITWKVINKQKADYEAKAKTGDEQVANKDMTVMDIILKSFMDGTFSSEDMRQHLETFIFGSFHTTGTELVLALKLIGANPKVEEQIYKEIIEVFGDSDRDVDRDDLARLNYLDAVVKETVRMYPIVPIIARDAKVDVQLNTLHCAKLHGTGAVRLNADQSAGEAISYYYEFHTDKENYVLPAGTSCIGSIYGLNRDPMWGDDVEKFKPERWLDPKRPAETMFAGFSLGRRNCIGNYFAIIVMKTFLVHILRRYRVAADSTEPVLKFNAYLQPVSGYHISLELRS